MVDFLIGLAIGCLIGKFLNADENVRILVRTMGIYLIHITNKS